MNLGSGPCEDDASQGAYDFKEVQTTLADLLADMQKDKNGYRIFLEPHDLSKYMAGTKSINVARFQRDARTRCKIFSENGTFQVKREHQTRFSDTRSYTLMSTTLHRKRKKGYQACLTI